MHSLIFWFQYRWLDIIRTYSSHFSLNFIYWFNNFRYDSFEDLDLKCYVIPSVANQGLEIGGLVFPACPMNEIYTDSQICSLSYLRDPPLIKVNALVKWPISPMRLTNLGVTSTFYEVVCLSSLGFWVNYSLVTINYV